METVECPICKGAGNVQVYTMHPGYPRSIVHVVWDKGKWSATSDSPECESFVNKLLQDITPEKAGKQITERMWQHGFVVFRPDAVYMDGTDCQFSHVATARAFYEENKTPEDLS